MYSRFRLVAALVCVVASACTDQPIANPTAVTAGAGAAPSLASANVAVGVGVGVPVNYDATKGGATFTAPAGGAGAAGGRVGAATALTYSIAFENSPNGLSAQGGTVTGLPAAPGVTWATITATDVLGRIATDRFAVVAFASGLATPTLPATPFGYSDAAAPLPAHFRAIIDGTSVTATDNTPAGNPTTNAGATLGRVLFYDMRVSRNDGLSCAGCHSPFIGFSDTPRLSVGFAGGLTARHAPSLANARFYQRGRFFWDERAATLEDQVVGPIQSGTEMGMTLEDLTAKLQVTPYYPALFTAAFGSPAITTDRLASALAQYVRSLVSAGSRYDRAFAGGTTPNFAAVFTPQEIQGEQLFRTTGCAQCHTTVAQVSDAPHNIGLDAVSTDTGAGGGAFKAPSLRNVAARPRYMHDGRFTSLEQVVEFFDSGVQPNANLDSRLKAVDGSPKRLALTVAQKAALVAYMKTLTDSAFLTAQRFANPFAPAVAPPPPPPPPAATPTAAVTIQATAYHPPTITVARGTVITWTNLDNARHSASFASAAIGATPIFTTGSRSLTMPQTPGTYNYQCAVHGAAMSGTVIVQ